MIPQEWETRHDTYSRTYVCQKDGKVVCEPLAGGFARIILGVLCDAHNRTLPAEGDSNSKKHARQKSL